MSEYLIIFWIKAAAIGSRSDISEGSLYGEVDTKVVDLALLQRFTTEAISGKKITTTKKEQHDKLLSFFEWVFGLREECFWLVDLLTSLS